MSLPTVYEYYTGGGISAGLSADQSYFTLNNRNITIYSGAMHYFRVPAEYWRDRLRKMRAAGLNTVETYVPWNLHEFQDGTYDIGSGGSDFSRMLDIRRFLQIAQEEDLLAIVRPGPYICSEWEFGGLPAWLLKNEGIKMRTSDEVFMDRVAKYFRTLLGLLTVLQFTNGGPIIAFQIENEYGSVYNNDTAYLQGLKQIFLDNGIKELLFTSDGPSAGNWGQIPGILYTANFAGGATKELDIMQSYQPGKPSMVMEYWSGWFDHWSETHHTKSLLGFTLTLLEILHYPASVNIYMFHGGTNFGFMNGANLNNGEPNNSGYQPTTNSYDYDAILNENGDYTDKYLVIREILTRFGKNPVRCPEIPTNNITATSYPELKILEQLTFAEMMKQSHVKKIPSKDLIPMELIPQTIGQNFGYVNYRKEKLDIPNYSELVIQGYVTDTAMVLLNGKLISAPLNTPADLYKFGYWKSRDQSLTLGRCFNCTLDIIVENWGRVNYGGLNQYEQYKGLKAGQVVLNKQALEDWLLIPMEFAWYMNPWWENWQPFDADDLSGPKLYRTVLHFDETPTKDTFVDMKGWSKGFVVVNDIVLSRYCKLGPQQTLYLPAPFLKKGDNEILIFEHFHGHDSIDFRGQQIFETLNSDFNTKGFVDEALKTFKSPKMYHREL